MISKKTIEAKYKRAEIHPKNTYLWDDMQNDLKLEVLKKVQLNSAESCIICFYKSTNYILLITTHRVIMLDNQLVTSILYKSISEVKLNEVFSGEHSKKNNDTINLLLKNGELVDIQVEEVTWPILYNIIRLLTINSSGNG